MDFRWGGYAAVKFSSLLEADKIIALSPQWSIEPDDVYRHDRRLVHHYSEELNKNMKICPDDVRGELYLFYDPYNRQDLWNASQIEKCSEKCCPIRTPRTGHETIDLFAGRERINRLIQSVIDGDIDSILRFTREYRRNIVRRHANIADDLYHMYPDRAHSFYHRFRSEISRSRTPGWINSDGSRARRILVVTNHLLHFTGSEIVALEVAEWFASRGHEVTLATHLLSSFMSEYLNNSFEVVAINERLKVSSFDLVWNQHNHTATLLKMIKDPARLPFIVNVSLSPYEAMEVPDLYLSRYLGIPVYANSEETLRASVGDSVSGGFCVVFKNAAPESFWDSHSSCSPATPLDQSLRVVLISNHIPVELMEALDALQRHHDTEVRIYGAGFRFQRVGPDDLSWADCVITIGKSVPYSLAAYKPVYMYDRFGGDGWLTEFNFLENSAYNFSGRPRCRKLSAAEIVFEITQGYQAARSNIGKLHEYSGLNGYRLNTYMQQLIEQLDEGQFLSAMRVCLRRALDDDMFLAHVTATAALRRCCGDLFLSLHSENALSN